MVTVGFLGTNDVGEVLYEWLEQRDDATISVYIETKDELELLREHEIDLVVSAGFRHIVPEEYLDIPPLGAVNIHKSYLPYNRGANHNVWSIIEDNPAGVSIHYMTAEVDGGPIIDRRKVPVEPDDNARDLYERLEKAQIQQFKETWPEIRDGTAETVEQDLDEGTYHRKSDFVSLWELNREERVEVGEFIDRLRALTFPPYKNAYFIEDGEKYYVEIDVTREGESEQETERTIPTYDEDEF
jgi:methionyl-tRNA formyltransferase